MSRSAQKRARVHDPSIPPVLLRSLGDGLYQASDGTEEYLTVGNGDIYEAISNPGPAIVDNSADLGTLQDGALLQSDSRVYVAFASPSRYSAMHLSSSLQMFHDCDAVEFRPFFEQFGMVKNAKNPTSATHACIRFDFSSSTTDDYFKGASESLHAVAMFINRVVCKAIRDFIEHYQLPDEPKYSPNETHEPLSKFLDWLQVNASETKLFIAVHHAHEVLERPLCAAYWALDRPSALDERLETLQRLLLTPIWSNLSSDQGVVRKFLIVGPHLLRGVFYPLDPESYPGLPELADLTDSDALHGLSSPQIRTLYSLPPSTMSREILQFALRHCNTAVSPRTRQALAREFPGIYTMESLESVLRVVSEQSSVLDEAAISVLPMFNTYLDAMHEAAARALYPLLLRNVAFRRKIKSMLTSNGWVSRTARSLGLVFSFDDLIDGTPADDQLLARVFMLGLMRKFEYKRGSETQVYYDLAGGCARVLMQKLYVETEPANYTADYGRRDPSPAYVDHGLNAKLDFNVNTFNILALTELSIATLIFDHYRPLENYKQLPSREETFQATMAKLHRAALLATFGDSAFVNAVQIEVAYRRRGNLFGDLIVKMTLPDGTEVFILHEYKSFDPGKTMNGTHAQLKAPRRLESQDLRDARTMLVGETKKTLIPIDMQRAWYNAMQQFLKEIASMRNLPPHWFFDRHPDRKTVDLPFPLSIDDICAFFFKEQDDMKGSGIGKDDVKRAVEEAAQAVKQVGGYGDVSILGVADHLAVIGEPNTMGWADKRITSLGPGRTVIIPFAVVNVAGALAFVEKLEPVSIDQKLGIVDRYPWHKDQSHAEVELELKLKRQYSWNNKQS